MKLPALKPVSLAPQPCKICGGAATPYGVVDFNKHCIEPGKPLLLPLCGVPVYYRRCAECGFIYTDAFDDWSVEDFRAHIYNDDYYASLDREYAQARPGSNAAVVDKFWGELRTTLRVLDYGCGNDALCASLRARGFTTAVSYDPIVPEYAQRPAGKFDLVTCFEVMEHMPDPMAGIAAIVECAAEPGLIFYSTTLQPDDMHFVGLNWWYVAPRNGHVSMFSKQSLAAAWGRHGYRTLSFNHCTHIAFRTLPSYVGRLESKVADLGGADSPVAA